MANTLAAVTPRLLAMGLKALRQQSVMPRLVNRAYDGMAAQRGATVDVPIPSAIQAQVVAPNNISPATADVAPTFVPIALDQWYEAPFYLTDQDMLVAMDGIIPMQASEAIKALANNMDQYILALYKKIYGYTGVAGTTPFATSPQGQPTEATNVRAILNKQLAPMDDRRFVLDPTAEAAAINLRAFQSYNETGQDDVIIKGQLGERLGYSWYMDQNLPIHNAGTITTGLVAKAATAVAVGAISATCTTAASTGATALVVGDIITFAGDAQTYVVTAAATQAGAAADVVVSFLPGKRIALVGGEAVAVKGAHQINLAFHRDCFAFATRPLESSMSGQLGSIIQSAVDDISGLTLRLEIRREYKRIRFSYDALYGGACIRPELGCRLAG